MWKCASLRVDNQRTMLRCTELPSKRPSEKHLFNLASFVRSHRVRLLGFKILITLAKSFPSYRWWWKAKKGILRTMPLKNYLIGMWKGLLGLLHLHHYVDISTHGRTFFIRDRKCEPKQRRTKVISCTNWRSLAPRLILWAFSVNLRLNRSSEDCTNQSVWFTLLINHQH